VCSLITHLLRFSVNEPYSYVNDGEEVNAYVIDTGILTTHFPR